MKINALNPKQINQLYLILNIVIVFLTSAIGLVIRIWYIGIIGVILYAVTALFFRIKYKYMTNGLDHMWNMYGYVILVLSSLLTFFISAGFIAIALFNFVTYFIKQNDFYKDYKYRLLDITYLIFSLSFFVNGGFLWFLLIPMGLLILSKNEEITKIPSNLLFIDLYEICILFYGLTLTILYSAWFIFVLLMPALTIYVHFKRYQSILFLKELQTKRLFNIVLIGIGFIYIAVSGAFVKASESGHYPHSDWAFGSEIQVILGNEFVLYGENTSMNQEHVYHKTWANSEKWVNDLHNIYVSNANVNQTNANILYTTGSKYYGITTNNEVFEPENYYKGNVARVLIYMYVTYADIIDRSKIDINLMKEWNRIDPPDYWEKIRNDRIEARQGNRNIFIDYYYLANFVG